MNPSRAPETVGVAWWIPVVAVLLAAVVAVILFVPSEESTPAASDDGTDPRRGADSRPPALGDEEPAQAASDDPGYAPGRPNNRRDSVPAGRNMGRSAASHVSTAAALPGAALPGAALSGAAGPARQDTGRGDGGPERRGAPATSGEDQESRVRIYGSIAVEKASGSENSLAGYLQVSVAGKSRSIPVSGGKFSVHLGESESIRFFASVLAGRPGSVISPTVLVAAGTPGPIRVVVRFDALTLLHLRSTETGEPLTDLEVLRVQDFSRSSLSHPGWALPQDSTIVSDESPVALDARIGSTGSAVAIHARAAGYQWKRVTVDLVDGGVRELELSPAGTLDLALLGDAGREGVMLRLRRADANGAPHIEMPATANTTRRVEGVLPGTWVVSLESGHWAHQPDVFDEIEIDLLAGDLLDLQLSIPADEDERVSVAGSVFIPAGWHLDYFSVRLCPSGPGTDPTHDTIDIQSSTMEAEEGAGGTRWYWGPVFLKPGTYGHVVSQVGYGDVFEVSEDELAEVYLELPPPVEITVQALLADGGGVAEPALIRWAPVRPVGVPGAGAVPVAASPTGSGEPGFFAFRVPAGTLRLSCSDVAYRPKHQLQQVDLALDNSFTLLLEPAMGMMLFLEDDGTSVPWDLAWHPSAQAQEGGAMVTRGRLGGGYRILVSEPGVYQVQVGELPGFLPVEPFLVIVRANEVSEAVIEIDPN